MAIKAEDLSKAQFRAGRALLAWSRERLAEEAAVSHCTVARMERENGGNVSLAVARSIVLALKDAGVDFIRSGVRLRDAAARRTVP